ncbi:ABC-type branched-subunit amino acid transport system substrate-binding protein [Kitasatospora sp. MAP12-15]|uniref:ABC transporter substrate-binding protein n=1 Tax=unclassified Kitasatospora TaxID=2633591 RepID=UPI002473D9F8|nr:ABC transporter substrate-binding protein [Kitasatospora sp. MAP12-44]MDH6108413.1 ABC-type branched-subunit amino acid transport system substrate-binding protein [Kitasatospora sp. MAP12-44]
MTSWTRPGSAIAAIALLPALLATSACGGSASAAADYAVMTWSPSGTGAFDRPGVTALAEVIGQSVNAKGGLNGHHLRVITCNEHNTVDGGTACVRQAVDAKVIAVIGSYSLNSDSLLPGLEEARIPYIGGYGLSAAEFSSPLSYPVAGGTPTLIAGNGRQLVAAGCRTIALVRPDTEAGDTLTGYLGSALRPDGVKLVDVRVSEQSPDYADAARKALGDDQPGTCASDALAPAQSAKLLDAYRKLAPQHTLLGALIGSVPQSVVGSQGAAGGPLDNAYVAGWYPPTSSHAWDALRAMVGGDNRIDPSDLAVQTTWVAYQVFLQATQHLQDAGTPLTAKSLRDQLDSGDTLDTGGVTPPLSWGAMLPSSDSPRLVNTWITYQQVKAGQLTEQQSGFLDMRWVLTGGTPPQ